MPSSTKLAGKRADKAPRTAGATGCTRANFPTVHRSSHRRSRRGHFRRCPGSSPGTGESAGYDLSAQDAADVADRLFESTSPTLTVELQGGDPLLAFDRIGARFYCTCREARVQEACKWESALGRMLLLDNSGFLFPEFRSNFESRQWPSQNLLDVRCSSNIFLDSGNCRSSSAIRSYNSRILASASLSRLASLSRCNAT